MLAAIGWHHLLSAYLERFKRYNIDIAGFLVTHADLEDDESRASTLVDTIKATWQAGILPIVNENDPISTEEMREVGRGADNDQNAFLLARIFDAHEIVIISNTDGAYRDHRDPNTRIDVLRSDQLNPGYISSLCEGKSGAGT